MGGRAVLPGEICVAGNSHRRELCGLRHDALIPQNKAFKTEFCQWVQTRICCPRSAFETQWCRSWAAEQRRSCGRERTLFARVQPGVKLLQEEPRPNMVRTF